jgi:hypothetical protein
MAQLTDEFDAPLVRLHSYVFDNFIDEVVLAVAEPAHRVRFWRIVRASLRKPKAARCEKVSHTVEAGLSIHI